MNRIAKFLRDYAVARFALPVGLILIVFGIYIISPVATRLNYPQTEATVTKAELYEDAYYDGDTHHDATYLVFVKYNVNGEEYEEEYGIFPKMKVGTTVKINYNPEDYHDIGQPNSMLLPYGMIAGGVAALAVGIVSIIHAGKKNKELKKQEEAWKNG